MVYFSSGEWISFRAARPRALLICSLVCGVCGGLPRHALAQSISTLGLEVRSRSWIADAAFDTAGFSKLCSEAGLALTPGGQGGGVVQIDYEETRGNGYNVSGFGSAAASYGTKIDYKMTLLAPDGSARLVLAAAASTPQSVSAFADLRKEAIADLKSRPQYHMGCIAMAAHMGSQTAAAKLLPWAVHEQEGLALLEKVGFTPATARERAFVAVARRDFVGSDVQNQLSREPLTLFIQAYYKDSPFGRHQVRSANREEQTALAAAVTTLASVGDSTAAGVFEGLLKECNIWRREIVAPVVVPTLAALSRVGLASAVQLITPWLECESCVRDGGQEAIAGQEINRAAKDALASLRARLRLP